MKSKRKEKLVNGLLALISLCAAFVVCELVFRHRYAHYFYAPGVEIQTIQSFLIPHPTLGFTWRKNIDYDGGIILKSEDVRFEPLSTDPQGFLNTPEAIARCAKGDAIDVIGLGDSFIEHGCYALYECFRDAGLFYYNMAIHRQSPPQYNIILENYAAPHKPTWVVYGLFENDFAETADYENWKRSGLDWFTYHSGTWCGPPVGAGASMRFLHKHLRGTIAFTKVLREKLDIPWAATARQSAIESDKVLEYVRDAHEYADTHGIRFLLVLIPSKMTTLDAPTPESTRYDALVAQLAGTPIHLVDLRNVFATAENPASLYYKIDGHWNETGIRAAAAAVLDCIRNSNISPEGKTP